MAFCSFAKDAAKSLTTTVENTFFTDYLTEADGEAIKAYLYGLYLCRNNEGEFTVGDMAKALYADEEKIIDYFRYWEEFDAVSIISEEPFTVKYLPLSHYGKPRRYKSGKYDDFNKSLQSLVSERMISTNEYSDYFSVMEDYSVTPEAMLMIAKYCVDLKGAAISGKYILAVAKDFANRGVTTAEGVEAELSDYNLKSNETQKVLAAMGLRRKADIDDFNYYSKWTKELLFSPSVLVYVAKHEKIKTPQRLDSVMMELYSAKKFSEKEIEDYFAKKAEVYDLAKEITRSLSVYCEVLSPVVETYVNPWISLGFSSDALKFIASYCFRRRKRSLESMDETVKSLYEKGLVTLSSIASYAKRLAIDDDFIKSILSVTGEDRRPNEWDRKNLSVWRSWGFSDDMIKAAASFASGKSSPVVYINAVLGDWKQKGINTIDKIPEKISPKQISSGKSDQTTATTREYTKEELNALISDIETVDF